MVDEVVVPLPDGRELEGFTTTATEDAPVVLWHHGTPHTGVPLEPVAALVHARGARLVTYARPGYGRSTVRPGRTVASAAADVAHLADALGVGRFVAVGASGGAPHALACAALLPDRVTAVGTLAGLAPRSEAWDWFAGMLAPGALRAAVVGREERRRFGETEEFDPEVFTPADWAALEGAWAALGEDAGRASAASPDGAVDDDVAYALPWGFRLDAVAVPAVLVHGERDRMVPAEHTRRVAASVPGATLWLEPDDGHVSVLRRLGDVLDRLLRPGETQNSHGTSRPDPDRPGGGTWR
jgi:pimeloyl-ACP methyl ester carboxylesterase